MSNNSVATWYSWLDLLDIKNFILVIFLHSFSPCMLRYTFIANIILDLDPDSRFAKHIVSYLEYTASFL